MPLITLRPASDSERDDRARRASIAVRIGGLTIDAGHATPLVGDFHFSGHLLLAEHPECALALDKYRINPGNVGAGKRHDEHFQRIIRAAVENGKPVRIGVNWG